MYKTKRRVFIAKVRMVKDKKLILEGYEFSAGDRTLPFIVDELIDEHFDIHEAKSEMLTKRSKFISGTVKQIKKYCDGVSEFAITRDGLNWYYF